MQKLLLSYTSLFLLVLVLSFISSTSQTFTNIVTDEIYIYYFLDYFFTYLLLFYFLYNLGARQFKIAKYLDNLSELLYKNRFFLLLIFLFTLYTATQSIGYYMQGAVRQELILEHGMQGLSYIFLSAFYIGITPFVLAGENKRSIKLLVVFGLIFNLLITGTRSELVYVAYIYITITMLLGKQPFDRKTIMLMVLFLLTAFVITITIQGRPVSDGLLGLINPVEKHFLYRAYSIHISQFAIEEMSFNFDRILYPFFGYPYEYIIKQINPSGAYIGSEFVSKYHIIGYDDTTGYPYLANVVYPWWSWFVGVYGVFGIFLKFLYVFLLCHILFRLKFFMLAIYLLSYALFIAPSGSPFMTLKAIVTLFILFVVDVLVRRWMEKKLVADS